MRQSALPPSPIASARAAPSRASRPGLPWSVPGSIAGNHPPAAACAPPCGPIGPYLGPSYRVPARAPPAASQGRPARGPRASSRLLREACARGRWQVRVGACPGVRARAPLRGRVGLSKWEGCPRVRAPELPPGYSPASSPSDTPSGRPLWCPLRALHSSMAW